MTVLADNFAKDILKKMKGDFLGQIYKATSNAYWVKVGEKLIKCVARGAIKSRGEDLCVGDFVTIENNAIKSIEQRKNRFIRPNVANVDYIVSVFSPNPKPDFYLIDKLYVNAVKEDVEMIIVVNKADIDVSLYQHMLNEYEKLGIKILCVSAKTGDGIDELKNLLKGKLSVFAGQSAVGKTSLVNALFNMQLKTGELSEKIARGKHTTTRSEIFEKDNIKIIDSPGFAVIDAMVELDELPECYPEYLEHAHLCKFRGCMHVNEPQCKVKQLVEDGVLSKERYLRYVEIYNELLLRRKNYD